MKKFFFYFFYIIIIFISIFLVDFFLTKILNNYEKKFFIKHPVYHHTFAKNKIFYSKGTKYFTDSLGFRNKKNLKLKQKSEKKRLLIIGDSFTEGIGLDYDKTFVGIISNILNKENIEVLNAGRASYSPVIYLTKIKYLIENEKLEFDEVMVFIDISDAQDEYGYFLNKGKVEYRYSENKDSVKYSQMNFYNKVRVFLDRNTVVSYFIIKEFFHFFRKKDSREKFKNILSDKFDRDKWTLNKNVYNNYGREGEMLMIKYMTELKDLLSNHSIKLSIGVYPWPSQVFFEDLNSRQVQIWKDWSKKYNIKFYNFFPIFVKKNLSDREKFNNLEEFYFPYDVHFNEKGNRAIAEYFIKEY